MKAWCEAWEPCISCLCDIFIQLFAFWHSFIQSVGYNCGGSGYLYHRQAGLGKLTNQLLVSQYRCVQTLDGTTAVSEDRLHLLGLFPLSYSGQQYTFSNTVSCDVKCVSFPIYSCHVSCRHSHSLCSPINSDSINAHMTNWQMMPWHVWHILYVP